MTIWNWFEYVGRSNHFPKFKGKKQRHWTKVVARPTIQNQFHIGIWSRDFPFSVFCAFFIFFNGIATPSFGYNVGEHGKVYSFVFLFSPFIS